MHRFDYHQFELFLKTVWPKSVPAYLPLGFKKQEKWKNLFIKLDDINPEEIQTQVQMAINDCAEVYVATCLRREIPEKGRGGQVDTCALPGFWLDVDIDSAKVPSEHDAGLLLEKLPEPSMAVKSGHGLHCWWLLDGPFTWEKDGWRVARDYTDAFQEYCSDQADRLGYKLDSVGDLARILRLPGTFNFKSDVQAVNIYHLSDKRYLLEDFKKLLKVRTRLPKTETLEKSNVDYTKLIDSLKKVKKEKTKEFLQKVLLRLPLAKEGERDNALQSFCGTVAFTVLGQGLAYSLEDIYEFILPSVLAMQDVKIDTANPPPSIATFRDKLTRAWKDAEEFFAKKREDEEGIRQVLIRATAQTQGAEAKTYNNLEEVAKEAGWDDVNLFSKHLMLQKDGKFYIWYDNSYKGPFTFKDDVMISLRDLWANLPVNLKTATKEGGERDKTFMEIIKEYSTVCKAVFGSLSIDETLYNKEKGWLFEAVCPKRRIKPVRHEDVEDWLMNLTEDDQDREKLFAWIASITKLDQPSCALLLTGPPGAGKSLLAYGLAKIWGTTPTYLDNFMNKNFNEDITACPLLLADEAIPRPPGKDVTAELRGLISATSFSLTRKYKTTVSVHGSVRLIITANNEDVLSARTNLSANDIRAYADRFLHIVTSQKAVDYLQKVDTAGWVENDKIAEYAMWLKENHVFVPGKRFIVEGREKSIHRSILIHNNRAIEWIARWLVAKFEGSARVNNVFKLRVGDGKLLANADAVYTHWDVFCKGEPPSLKIIGEHLKLLSTNSLRISGKINPVTVAQFRCHDIKPNLIAEWAYNNQFIDDKDELLAFIKMTQEEITQREKKMKEKVKVEEKRVSLN